MLKNKLEKTVIYTYLAILIVISVMIVVLYQYVRKSTRENAIDNQKEVTRQITDQVDTFLDNMDKIALQVMGNSIILESFQNTDKNAQNNYFDANPVLKAKLQSVLMKINGPGDVVEKICVYNDNMDYLSYGVLNEDNNKVKESLKQIPVNSIIEKIDQTKHSKRLVSIHDDYWRNSEEETVSVYRNLKSTTNGRNYGLIEVQRPKKELQKIFALENSSMNLFLLDSEGALIYSSGTKADTKLQLLKNLSLETAGISEKQKEAEGKEQQLITWNTGENFGWRAVVMQSEKSLLSSLGLFTKFMWGFIVLLTAANVIFLFVVIKKLLMPLKLLNKSVNEVSLNNLFLQIDNESQIDEVENINKAFRAMFERLNSSIENEIKSNFLALQAQMNPHFLYNTLAIISAVGIEDDNERIPVLCEKLSTMIRYSSSYEERMAKLPREIKYVEDYLCLMRERYDGKVEYEIETDGQLEDVLVPKISIQPLAENCFKHGFANNPFPWKIKIRGAATESGWYVEIEDNGCGMTREEIAAIEDRISQMVQNPVELSRLSIGGLGLVNTMVRFQMLDPKVYYRIQNHDMGGLVIRIGGDLN